MGGVSVTNQETEIHENSEERADYGCEIVSLLVLLALSALSHVWVVFIAVIMSLVALATVSFVTKFLVQSVFHLGSSGFVPQIPRNSSKVFSLPPEH